MTRFQRLLDGLRKAFPSPVSDPVQDGYVVFSILKALDQVDALKSQTPLLGSPKDPDYDYANTQRIAEDGHTVEEVIPELVRCLEGMIISGHPRSQVNVFPHPSIPSIIGVVLPSLFSPNLCSDEAGGGVNEAEVRVAAMVGRLVGYSPQEAGGLFTFGGTGALLYGTKIGLEKAVPNCLHSGLKGDVVIIASQQSHSACLNVAGWLGIGHDNLIYVPTHLDNSMDIEALEQTARNAIASGQRIAAIVATMGTTDAFGIDDLAAIHQLRGQLVNDYSLDYVPHIHADAVIGWAWSVFDDYNFQENRLGFRGRTLRALAAARSRIQHLHLADSIGVDFHKTGFTPYISSLVLIRQRADLQHIVRQRDAMPYLFHAGQYHPGMYTLETSRSGVGPMVALASLLLLGKEGFRTLLGHAVEMAEILREQIGAQPELTVMNDENHGPVTLIRAYPTGVDTFTVKKQEYCNAELCDSLHAYNDFNRKIYQRVHSAALKGQGVAIGLTNRYRQTDYGEPIVALKSYVLSPFADESRMRTIVDHISLARDEVELEGTG